MSDCVNKALHALNFDEIRRSDADEWEPLDDQFSGVSTDDVHVILRPADREGVAHLRKDGQRLAVARKMNTP